VAGGQIQAYTFSHHPSHHNNFISAAGGKDKEDSGDEDGDYGVDHVDDEADAFNDAADDNVTG
jgi:hypothetical protein